MLKLMKTRTSGLALKSIKLYQSLIPFTLYLPILKGLAIKQEHCLTQLRFSAYIIVIGLSSKYTISITFGKIYASYKAGI